jgi:hypothetical protein
MNFSEIQQHPKFLVSPDFIPPIKGEHILNRTFNSLFKDFFFSTIYSLGSGYLYLFVFELFIAILDYKFNFSTDNPTTSIIIRVIFEGIITTLIIMYTLGKILGIANTREIYFYCDNEFLSTHCFLYAEDGLLTLRSSFEDFSHIIDISLIKESGEMEILLKGYGGWLSKMRKREVTRRVRVTPERRFNDKTNELYKYLKQIVDIRDELQNKKGL